MLAVVAVVLAALPAAAAAAPPANDAPEQAGDFTTFFAPNGTPRERAAVAELAEATADAGIPRCLGPDSFARTVWYRVPATSAARELTIEATGRTTDPVDLAAFVQPASGVNLGEPNSCSGEGAGGSEAAEDRTTAVSLRIPAGRTVLVQVGRRGPVGSAGDEQAILSLASADLPALAAPAGDSATGAPGVTRELFAVGGATLTEEDPAQPACPSRGSVWRDLGPAVGRTADITVRGDAVGTVTLFQGVRPDGENALACVNREREGSLRLSGVPVVTGERLWARVGTDRPAADAQARILVPATTVAPGSGGPGTPGAADGPGSASISFGGATGSPSSGGPNGSSTANDSAPCLTRAQGRTAATRTRITLVPGARRFSARQRNRRRALAVRVSLSLGPVCRLRVALVGPRGRVYARGTVSRLSGGRVLTLKRTRRLVRGTYRLRATAAGPATRRVRLLVSSRTLLRIR